jgi:hypothetical protein
VAWDHDVLLCAEPDLQKDRLPALAATARRLQVHRIDDEYLAGLWKSSLWFDLLWMNIPGSRLNQSLRGLLEKQLASRSVSSDQIPTWSRAYTNGQVYLTPAAKVLESAHVQNIVYSVHGSSVAGDIREAPITLRAPLIDSSQLGPNYVMMTVDEALDTRSVASRRLIQDMHMWDDHGRDDYLDLDHDHLD